MNNDRLDRLIQEIRDGNYILFEEIVETYQDKLTAFIYRMVKDKEEARDICQDTFLKAYRSIKSFRGQSKFSTWLFQIGYFESLNSIRSSSRKVNRNEELLATGSGSADNPETNMEISELKNMIDNALESILDRYRAALHLHYRESLDYREIAQVMDIPVNTVKSHIHRGKEMIKQMINKAERL